jgi:hypothetical protein
MRDGLSDLGLRNRKIEWCDHTLNSWIGCQKVSPGYDYCYAEEMMDHRYVGTAWQARAHVGSVLEAAVPMGQSGKGIRNAATSDVGSALPALLIAGLPTLA